MTTHWADRTAWDREENLAKNRKVVGFRAVGYGYGLLLSGGGWLYFDNIATVEDMVSRAEELGIKIDA